MLHINFISSKQLHTSTVWNAVAAAFDDEAALLRVSTLVEVAPEMTP